MDQWPSIRLPPPRQTRWWRWGVAVLVLGMAIGLVGAYVEIPYYSLGPGPARDVSQLVRVEGERTYASDGVFFLTTVAVSSRPVTLFEALVGWIDPAISLVKRDVIVRPGLSDEQQDQFNLLDMEESKYAAIISALAAVGLTEQPIPGARVVAVAAGFPAAQGLRPGDLITDANGVRVRNVVDLVDQIIAKPAGATLALDVIRGDVTVDVSIVTRRSPVAADEGRPVIGAALAPAFRLPVGVTVDSENIGGPSAGLAFALTIADALVPEDLTRGHQVAVTGTIDLEGHVGPVGGVEFKVRAAEREGADIFLVPKDEVKEAKDAASHVRVIGVSTLQEAIAALRTLGRLAPAALAPAA